MTGDIDPKEWLRKGPDMNRTPDIRPAIVTAADDRNIARIRTAVPQVWGAIIVYVFHRLGYVPDDVATDLATVVVIPIAGGVVYEIGRAIEQSRFKVLSRILLGSTRTPFYY